MPSQDLEKTKLTLYIQNPDIMIREEDINGALLFNPDSNQIKLINYSGLLIWKMCDQGRSLEDLVGVFRESFENIPEDLPHQIDAFIQDMVSGGLIGVVSK